MSLDPEDWESFSHDAHAALDLMIAHLKDRRAQKVWQPAPDEVRAQFVRPLPKTGRPLGETIADVATSIIPYATGNTHPGFMGWVHGGGSADGMIAEMLAAGMNANLGGRNHIPIEVERQITQWMRDLFSFPETTSGLFVTGSSLANFIAVLVARTGALGAEVRTDGLGDAGLHLRAYTSEAAHRCIAQAMDMAGIGANALRMVPVDGDGRMNLVALQTMISADRDAGLTPFLVIGTAGTVNIGAIDPLDALADLCEGEGLRLHVDGAFGALAMMSPALAPLLKGIERADSIAFDFHKWLQVPYDAGFVLVRDGALHRATFAGEADYLRRDERGLAGNSPWPSEFGPDLSRGFRALKVWMTLNVHGADRMGAMMEDCCAVARHLAERIDREPALQRLAPVALNIVCFRHCTADSADIVAHLHLEGDFVPSATFIDGETAIRAAIVNHRTAVEDVDRLVDAVLKAGKSLA